MPFIDIENLRIKNTIPKSAAQIVQLVLTLLTIAVLLMLPSLPLDACCQLQSKNEIQYKQTSSSLVGTKPNIILIITDDQGYGPIGRHGHPWIETPAMDKLFDESIRFTNFLVCPTCAPTRSAMMTGRHPMKNGVTHTLNERERMTLDVTTLPQVLKSVGYQTGIFGKWHLGDEDDYQPQNRGFDEAFIHGAGGIGQAYNCSCGDAPGNKYFNPTIRHNGKFVKTQGFCTDIFFAAALTWIKESKEKDEPFFAYIATNAPHSPYVCRDQDSRRFADMGFAKNQAGFYGMIENIDANLGKLMTKVNQWDLRRNTIVIFMSDNGMAWGSGPADKPLGTNKEGKPLMSFNAGMRGQKGSADEGGVRVPFFVSWPQKIKTGIDAGQLAAHIDILPTLAQLAGAEIPENQVEGKSLLPIFEDVNSNWDDRFLFTHLGRWKSGKEPNDFKWKNFAVRNSRFRMIGEDQLYDMHSDPGQTANVFDKHPQVVRQMKEAYAKFWGEARPLMVNETAPLSKTRPFHEAYKKQLASGGIPDWIPTSLEETVDDEKSSRGKPEKLAAGQIRRLKQVVQTAFLKTHDGYSSDEVILDDELFNAFLGACQNALPEVDRVHFGWTLINLRKAGKLDGKVTKRKKRVDTGDYVLLAEIAARKIHDKHQVSTDRMMTSPNFRAEFDATAKSIDSTADIYLARKTAFQLRKKRQLRPELITRIATWGRQITEINAEQLKSDPTLAPHKPGVYIFRDKSGYLYIGESSDLQARLKKHLLESDRKSLANYLKKVAKDVIVEIHSFDPDSQAKDVAVRRAYESELIRSRKPRLNIAD